MSAVGIQNYEYWYPESAGPALSVRDVRIQEGGFVLLTGASGSGKSTFLRALGGLVPRFYGGKAKGGIRLFSKDIDECSNRELVETVGSVFQDPESQLFMTKVEREVGFGLQNLGVLTKDMLRQVSEALASLGISGLAGRDVASLSGGEKQKLAIASVLAMRPRMLLLDEPTSQLDPVAADELLRLLKRVNEDLGMTIVLTEHSLDRVFGFVDRVLFCDAGRITDIGSAKDAAGWLLENRHPAPTLARLFKESRNPGLPLTVKEARAMLPDVHNDAGIKAVCPQRDAVGVLRTKDLSYSYDTNKGRAEPTLSNMSLEVYRGEFVALLGENGAGKSTLLRLVAGLLKPLAGTIERADENKAFGVALLSQNPNDHLTEDTVKLQIERSLKRAGRAWSALEDAFLCEFGLSHALGAHPFELSSGERQRVALLSVLASDAGLLLLDEPTRGMDASFRALLGKALKREAGRGRTIVLVTHDVELVAEYASRVLILAAGRIVADGTPEEVLDGALYYSPVVNRLFARRAPGVVRYASALSLLRGDTYAH